MISDGGGWEIKDIRQLLREIMWLVNYDEELNILLSYFSFKRKKDEFKERKRESN